LAIVCDFSLDQPVQLQAARATFEAILEDADAEDVSGFDPSGSSGLDGMKPQNEGESESGQSMPEWCSNTDDTSASQGVSVSELENLDSSDTRLYGEGGTYEESSAPSVDYNAQLEKLDPIAKEAALIETFPCLKPFDIKWSLRKSNGNASLAIEDLLNQVFLEENGSRYRGIEGFSETDLNPRQRKGKGRKARSRFTDDASSAASEVDTPLLAKIDSKWDTARQDVEFISSRAQIPMQQVSTLYHSSGASVFATIRAIITAHTELKLTPKGDPNTSRQVQDLRRDFPAISFEDLIALVQLAHPSYTAAHELAEALVSRPPTPLRTATPIRLEFRLPPPDLSDPTATKQKPYGYNALHPSAAPSNTASQSPLSALSSDYRTLRDIAFDQAAAAYKKSKSDPLMGGAAAYYSSVGRDLDARTRAAVSAEADAMVASQSSDGVLDLHGVNVKEAVRITRDKVLLWWARRELSGSPAGGYKIVIGKGTHSVGGRSKLGPSVGGMLIREGWKVEVGSGVLVVTGQVRKR
jgi:hypothetical protein